MFTFIDDINGKIGYIKDKRLVQYKDIKEKSIVNSIYKARVIREDRSLKGYIVNFNKDQMALLRYKEALKERKGNDIILVEITHDYLDEKIPLCSEYINIKGDFAILKRNAKANISFSRKIKDENFKKRVFDRFSSLNYDILIRTRGYDANLGDIEKEINFLIKRLKIYEREINFLPVPDLVYLNDKILYEYVRKINLPLLVNDKKRLEEFKDMIVTYDKDFSVYENFLIKSEYERFKERKILFSGSNIVIDRLEALTVIDVNKGGTFRDLSFDEASIRTNEKALIEISNAISLLGIRGLLVIDFINMKKEARIFIERKFREYLDFFDLNYKINGFTRSNLFELLIY